MTLIAVGLGFTWQFWPWLKERVQVSQLRERVLHAKGSAEAGKAYRALLEPNNRRRFERLAKDDDPSIALKALFELLADRTDGYAKLPPDLRSKFVSILEKKTRLTPPDWWIQGLQDAFPWMDRKALTYAHKVNDEESVIITSDGCQLVLTANQWEKISRSTFFGKQIALKVASAHSYLATFDDVGWGYELNCLDTATGRTVWKSPVWAEGVDNLGGISGVWSHGAQIEVQDDRVIVWGAGTGGTYLEAFDALTGECQLRFCTEYWYSGTYQ